MNKEQSEIMRDVKDRMHQIISLYQNMKEEKRRLVHEKMDLMERVESLSQENEQLKHRYNTLKLAKSISGEEQNSHQAKIKINQIVREIDKCISLLNK